MEIGKERVKGSIPAQEHRKNDLTKRPISQELLKIGDRF